MDQINRNSLVRTGFVLPGVKRSSQNDYSVKGRRTVQIIGDAFGESPKQIQRYLKIADLIPELLEKLDKGDISFNPAYEIAFLKENEQKQFLEAMKFVQSVPSVSQAQRIKKLSQDGELTIQKMKKILSELKKGDVLCNHYIIGDDSFGSPGSV